MSKKGQTSDRERKKGKKKEIYNVYSKKHARLKAQLLEKQKNKILCKNIQK